MTIAVGATIPNTTLAYVPYSPELDDGTACGVPTKVQTHDEFKGKKVVLVFVPGSFTPTCHVRHIPPFIEKYDQFKGKGVDKIFVVAANDCFVQSAWGVQNKAKDKVIFASDVNLEFSKGVDCTVDMSAAGFGLRSGRYVVITDDLKVTHFAAEASPGELEVTSAEAVLAKL